MNIPQSEIVIKNGQVIRIVQWAERGGQPFKTVDIQRQKKSFRADLGDAITGHWYKRREKTLESVLKPLVDETAKASYLNLFSLRGMTSVSMLPVRFQSFKVTFKK